MDLDAADLAWDTIQAGGSTWLGCRVPIGRIADLIARGATVLPAIPELPFDPYRAALYDYEELAVRTDPGDATTSTDARIGAWFRRSTSLLHDALARGIHDATIDAALERFVHGPDRRVVGVMGGHDVRRDTDLYARTARLGRDLARTGYCVATGGGPGIMEAAQLGAWLSAVSDNTLDAEIARLAEEPAWDEAGDAYTAAAVEVRDRCVAGADTLGVPTWVYAHEPTSPFATHIAKYFANSIRENGLLAIARSGVVFAPGGPGTAQELFTDAAQNSYDLVGVRSPIVFFDREHFTRSAPGLVEATVAQASAGGWDGLVCVTDDPEEVVGFVTAHDPLAALATTPPATAGRVRKR